MEWGFDDKTRGLRMTMSFLWPIAMSVATLWPGPAIETGLVRFEPTAGELAIASQFRLKSARFRYELEPWARTSRCEVLRLRFPSPVVTVHEANNTVHAEYFRPVGRSGRRPGVVVLHILGADFPLSRYLALRLADHGVAALFVKLPYYGERRPSSGQGSEVRFLSADIERSVASMRQAVLDVRRAIAWLAERPEVDPANLGVTGISLGGIVGSLVTAVEPRARSGVFLLAGGDLATILWEMPEGARYRRLWLESGRTLEDLRRLTQPWDPLTHARGLIGKRILMIAGKADQVVPASCTTALWIAAGKPAIEWLDCGHYSAVGYLLPGIRHAVDFLDGS